ncbi:YDG/SRA domain-containing protein [Hymenobacter sp. GOD-10R]|uniref:YDG/SRA domain-containing protein n=1 Tax=Hymenobacter sp. GOD-10R TaxID=3093922 RepID=UPI002D7865E5|nr:YDG/SRA domain-containing protein [Hymenobacter sp. GOD-10R]WRQ29652.1 YDG/SRA domain-containing protein [Hymenobacter sp. GOD-10R]
MARQFGHVGSYRPGDFFANRLALSAAGLHRPTRAGISGTQREGADSIVLADAYEDDVFTDDEICYTGHGGRDPRTGKQVTDQVLTDRNLALVKSQETGKPVRVLRKVEHEGSTVFRYEGLFRVAAYEYTRGKSGYGIWLFRLVPLGAVG